MKKIFMAVAVVCSVMISAQAQDVAVQVDTVKANADLEKYYEREPSYDKTKEDGKKTGQAFKKAAKATKRKLINGEENTGAGEATKEAFKATGETVVEATKTTGRYIKKQTPIVVDSIKSKSKRTKEKIKNW